jgi:hypothetical protein
MTKLIDQLTQPCPACSQVRELLDTAAAGIRRDPQHALRAKFALADVLECSNCNNRGVVLTEDGQALLRFFTQWDTSDIPEPIGF